MSFSKTNYEGLQLLFGRDLRDVYPEFLRFDCPGHLPMIFKRIWQSETEIHYEIGHRALLSDILIQGPQMVISVKPKERQVEAVSTSFALPFGEVVIPYEFETRDFQPKKADDQNLFLYNWLDIVINKGFQRVRPQLPEYDAEAHKSAAHERKKMHELLAIASVVVGTSGKGASIFYITD